MTISKLRSALDLCVGGEIDLATAQREIASNWIAAHKKYLAGEPPVELHARVFEWRVPTAGPALH
jgi:hypothetical protein